jgi:hypothetical protein
LKQDSMEWFVVPPFRPGPQPTEKLAAALAQAFSEKGEHLSWEVIHGWLQSPRPEESAADEVVEAGPDPAESIQAAKERLMQALDAIESQLPIPDDQVIHYLRKLREYLSEPDPGPEGVVGSAVTSTLVSVVNRLQRIGSGREATVVLVVDQFEELLGHDADHPATRFLALLRQVLTNEHCPLLIIGTMRSDFLGVLQACSSLPGMGFRSFSVGPMGREGMRQIVEEPAVLAQIQLASGLTDRLLNDTGTADALPLLAFTLRELWDGRADGAGLTLKQYDDFGGLAGAVQRKADEVLATSGDTPISKPARSRPAFAAPRCTAGSITVSMKCGVQTGWVRKASATSPATWHMYGFTPARWIGMGPQASGAGVNTGTFRLIS